MVTNAVSHGLDLVCSVLTQPGDAIMVEVPTYFLALGIFRSRGLEVVPAPTDEYGLKVDSIEALLDARPPGSAPVRMLYTIPGGHNPTGVTLPSERRAALVDIARSRGFLVLADEVYHLLSWHPPGTRPPRMACFDPSCTSRMAEPKASHDPDYDPSYLGDLNVPASSSLTEAVVVSVSSFTKILSPGLRIGWIEAAPAVIERLGTCGYLASGGCVAPFVTDVILRPALLNGSVDAALQELVTEYSSRARRLADALTAAGLPPLVRANAGYFLWVPLGVPAEDVLQAGKEHFGVSFLPGARCDPCSATFSGAGGPPEHCARVCFAWLPSEDLEEGARRLGLAVQAVRMTAG